MYKAHFSILCASQTYAFKALTSPFSVLLGWYGFRLKSMLGQCFSWGWGSLIKGELSGRKSGCSELWVAW